MTQIQSKAATLLMEIKSLQSCDPSNTIGAFSLLNEILKDAESLAKHTAETPMELSKRLKKNLEGVSMRSRNAMKRSQNAIARSNIALEKSREALGNSKVGYYK